MRVSPRCGARPRILGDSVRSDPGPRRSVPSETMRILVTGVSGYVGAALVAAPARATATRVRGFARSAARVDGLGLALDELVVGDATTGAGLEAALDGIDVAYYLIHSMEGAATGAFAEARARGRRGVRRRGRRRPACGASSTSAASCPPTRRSRAISARAWRSSSALLAAVPEAIALRASIVIGARSRSFRFLVRLIERLPVLALPAWREHRTAPIDGRDVLEFLAARRRRRPPQRAGRSWDIGGPDVMTYADDDRPHRRRHAGPPARRSGSTSRSRRSPPWSPPRSRARTPR